jgi:hypothetical protein
MDGLGSVLRVLTPEAEVGLFGGNGLPQGYTRVSYADNQYRIGYSPGGWDWDTKVLLLSYSYSMLGRRRFCICTPI